MDWVPKTLDALADEVGGDWIVNLTLIGILAYVITKPGPVIIDAYVRDRDSRRRHLERMTELRRHDDPGAEDPPD